MAITLVVETGAGIAGANTYYSLASANSYFQSRGVTTWEDADSADKQVSLIKATSYMETLPWIGLKTYSTNPLDWPRRNVVDKNGYYVSATAIPLQIKQGQAEVALRYLTGSDPLPDLADSGQIVRERVDVIEVEYTAQGKTAQPTFSYVDALFSQFLLSSLNVNLSRA